MPDLEQISFLVEDTGSEVSFITLTVGGKKSLIGSIQRRFGQTPECKAKMEAFLLECGKVVVQELAGAAPRQVNVVPERKGRPN